jgi:hypothetical protein
MLKEASTLYHDLFCISGEVQLVGGALGSLAVLTEEDSTGGCYVMVLRFNFHEQKLLSAETEAF